MAKLERVTFRDGTGPPHYVVLEVSLAAEGNEKFEQLVEAAKKKVWAQLEKLAQEKEQEKPPSIQAANYGGTGDLEAKIEWELERLAKSLGVACDHNFRVEQIKRLSGFTKKDDRTGKDIRIEINLDRKRLDEVSAKWLASTLGKLQKENDRLERAGQVAQEGGREENYLETKEFDDLPF